VTRRPPGTWATNHLADPILRPLLRTALIRDRQVSVREVIEMQRRQLLNLTRLVDTA